MKKLTILRQEEYSELSKVSLYGKSLDLGGADDSAYHSLIKGSPEFVGANYDSKLELSSTNFNAEGKFPLEDKSFDNVLAMNFIEHVFDTNNVFSEVSRIIKPGGLFVAAIPFMHHVHGSPDDFVRYTESAYKKFAEKYDFDIVTIKPLGFGLFSLIFQTFTIYKTLPFVWLYNLVKYLCIAIDQVLLLIPYYRRLADSVPLGYFWIMKKK